MSNSTLSYKNTGILNRLLNTGSDVDAQIDSRIAYRNTNISILVLVLVALIWAPLSYFFDGNLYVPLINIGFAAAFLVCFILMVAGYRTKSRFLLIAVSISFYLTHCYIYGPISGVEIYLVPITMMIIAVFTKNEERLRVAGFALLSCGIGLQILIHNLLTPLVPQQHTDVVAGFYVAAIITSLAIATLVYNTHFSAIENYLQLRDARNRSEELVSDFFPELIADRMKQPDFKGIIADSHGDAAILFADLVGFSLLAKRLSPHHLVELLNEVFSKCDSLAKKHGVEKIKTIGDCYMAATGVAVGRGDGDLRSLFTLGLGIIDVVEATSNKYGFDLGVRVGIGSGSAISGVIGEQKKSFDMWGAAVDLAKRMESNGTSGNIHISESAYWRLKDHWDFKQIKTDSDNKSSAIRSFIYVTEYQTDQP